LIAGPFSGYLSDRFGARPFAVGGMVAAAGSFALLELLPINFSYIWFGLILLLNGLAMGLFASPNRAAIMNGLPPDQRGQGSGMATTGMNASMVLSIGIFFTLIIVGLAASLPAALYHGLIAHGVPAASARQVANLPPTAALFSAFLGYNPIQELLGPSGVLGHLPHAQSAFLAGRSFFPNLIAGPFKDGLHEAIDFAIACCVIAAGASAMLGKQFFYKAPTDLPGIDAAVGGATPRTDNAAADRNGTGEAGAAYANASAAGPPQGGDARLRRHVRPAATPSQF
jgi:MFS family permease